MSAEPRATHESLPPAQGGIGLSRDALGRLVLHLGDGEPHVGVTAVRAFPISAPDDGVALVDADGRELAWIARLDELPGAARELVEEELAAREFMPVIRSIRAVSGFVTPCTWHVTTDRGDTRFVLPGEEAIRRLSRTVLLIADNHGIHYLVRDVEALDRHSRRLLDRFL